MIQRKSRWSDPPVIIAALAVLNGGYWQYQAIGRADNAALVKQVSDNTTAIALIRQQLDINKANRDRQIEEIMARLPNRR